jgi:RNA polymerase sigma factor (TIGR02999 family)
MEASGEVTRLLSEAGRGNKAVIDQLLPLVYPDLHRIASSYFRGERREHTLQPTALVNEAYLRLVGQNNVDWRDRLQFLGVAAILMRRILVNYARDRRRAKRGNAPLRVDLDSALIAYEQQTEELLAIDEALTRLADLDAEQARLVELRFFGGVSMEETAELLGLSLATAKRRWESARAWLRTQVA